MHESEGDKGRRARTRARIRDHAHRLFDQHGYAAVTMADIARDAGVAIQTIFNNFSSKEELFFDGRTPWVDGPAAAVRGRPGGADPLDALRDHLLASVRGYLRSSDDSDRARFLEVVEASPALRAHERVLVLEAESRLRVALAEAWPAEAAEARTEAAVIAAAWLAITRSLLAVEGGVARPELDPEQLADGVTMVSRMVLETLRAGVARLVGIAVQAAS
ncbi:TetR/AcrR family transcriptional regulator [Geodermatophilus sp. FMUSA9-8]|uniref:TetR/AcrR family transcriptional regulator n=1 Tax=Geodermatophilus sp. FMUSA9-8 TaxID=3120155 RepID=UPI0030086C46